MPPPKVTSRPAPVVPTPLPEPVIKKAPNKEALAAQIAEMEKRNQPSVDKAEKLLEDIEDKERREALGLDIEFDITKLITEGMVEKKGIKITDKIFLDMHTLSKEENLFAEQMVEALYVPINTDDKNKLTKSYFEAKSTAMLSMSITRIVSKEFKTPPLNSSLRETEEFKKAFEDKKTLYGILMKMADPIVDAITFVYMNLGRADILIEGEKQKKSSRP